MAKGQNIGFLNFGIGGDDSELKKILADNEKRAKELQKTLSNLAVVKGASSAETLQSLKLQMQQQKNTAAQLMGEQKLRTETERTTAAHYRAQIAATQHEKALQSLNTTTRYTGDSFRQIQSLLLKLGGTAALISLGKQIIEVRGEFQQLGIAFETMLGSKVKADQLMQEAIQFAQKTPFTLTDVATNIKQLMAMGIATEDVMDTMKALGDVAAGVSVPISRIAINYGQVATLGKLQTRELRDFSVAGVPLIDELAKNLGKTKAEIQDMISASQIGFKDVERAFQTMSSEGGKFYNLMEKTNKSVTGQISNLQDKIQVMMNSIGQANEGLIYGGISGLAKLVEHYQEVIKVIEVLIAAYGTYRATLMVAAAAQAISTKYGVYDIATKNLQIGATIRATVAQSALNKALMTNPWGVLITGITTLVTALILFRKRTDDATGITAGFTKNLSEATGEAKKLFKAITDSKTGTDQHAKAIQTVNDKYKEYLPNLLTEKSSLEEVKKAQDAVTESMARSLAFKAQQDQLTDLKTNTDEATTAFYLSIDKASGNMTDAQKGQIKAMVEQYKDQVKAEFEKTGKMSDTFSIDLYKIFNQVSGGSIGTQAAYRIKTAIIDLIESEKELDKQTEGLKTTYQSYLSALGLTGRSSEDSSTAIKTVGEQIKTTTEAIASAEKKLTDLRAPGSQATLKDIEDQEKVLEELRKQLQTLTGVKEKVSGEVKDLSGQISDLYKQLETADEKDRQIIAARIIELQKEKLLREQIAETAVKSVRNEVVPKTLTPIIDKSLENEIKKVGEDMVHQFGTGTVDLLSRPLINTIELAIKGWKDVGEGIATVFSSQYGIRDKNGKEHEILVTPILPDGTVLSQQELEDYIFNVLAGTNDILKADKKGIILSVDVDPDGSAGEKLHQLQEIYYDLIQKRNSTLVSKDIFTGNVEPIKKVNLEFDKLNKKIEETKKKAASMPGVVDPEKFKKFLDNTQEALHTLRSITSEYEEQLGLTEEQAQVIQDDLQSISGIADIASGNYIQGVAKIVSSFLKYVLPQQVSLAEQFGKIADNIDRVAKSVDIVTESLSNMNIDASYTSLTVLRGQLQSLAESARDLNKELNTSPRGNSYGQRRESYSMIARMMEERANLEEEITKLSDRLLKGNLSIDQRDAINAILESYNSLIQQIDDTIGGIIGIQTDSLKESLVDVFFESEDAAVAWGDKVNEVIENIAKKQLISKLLTDPVNDAINDLINNYSDGELNTDELKQFKDAMNAIYESTAPAVEAAKKELEGIGIDLAQPDESSSSSSTGITASAKSLTEETGNILASYINAIRADGAAQKQMIERQVAIMEANTTTFAQMHAELVRIQVNTLATANNTLRGADSNDQIAETTNNTYSLLKRVTTKGSGVSINIG